MNAEQQRRLQQSAYMIAEHNHAADIADLIEQRTQKRKAVEDLQRQTQAASREFQAAARVVQDALSQWVQDDLRIKQQGEQDK